MRRQRYIQVEECRCDYYQHTGESYHRFGCPGWGINAQGGDSFKSFKAFLGSPRTPYAKWAATVSPYPWPLWRNTRRKPKFKVETGAEIRARLLQAKPRYHPTGCACERGGDQSGCTTYGWKMWYEHKGAREVTI